MSMVINHNIAALNTYRQLTINSANGERSLEKLSSGLRINRAGDDAAGLAISEKMRGQISGLSQASRNAQDGISLIQTAEGALNETHSILQRMRELSVQSSSDTNTDQDRKNLQDEMDQLTKEVDRIRDTTQFNTKNLLNGSMTQAVTTAKGNIVENAALTSGAAAKVGLATKFTALSDKSGNSLGIATSDTITLSYVKNGVNFASTIKASTAAISQLDTVATALTMATNSGAVDFKAAGTGFSSAINGLTITVKDSNGNIKAGATNALSSLTETQTAADQVAEGRAVFQIGANSNQNLMLDIKDMGATALGVNSLKVDTQAHANEAVTVVDSAIQKVSAQRSSLGAMQNRLEHTINNLGTSSENLTAAESRVRDVDMAKEMMNFSKNNILNQAATAMLAQANQQPQGVLQLLR